MAYAATKGGEWRKWKYKPLYDMTRYFTRRFVDTKEGDELIACPNFTEEDQ